MIMPLPEMPCQEIVEVITQYLEGTLPELDRARFEEHLSICGPCRLYLQQMRETIEVLGKLEANTLPQEDQDRLVTLFREWRQGNEPVHDA